MHFNVGSPRMFDVRSWCSTRSSNVSKRSTNLKAQYTEDQLPSSSQITACDWWQLNWCLIVVCESWLSAGTLYSQRWMFRNIQHLKNFLHLHMRGYFLKRPAFNVCERCISPQLAPQKKCGESMQQAYLDWNYSNCLTRLCKDDDNAMQAPWDVWTSTDTLCLAQWRWNHCIAWPTPGCDPSKLAILGRHHPVFQLLPLEGCRWCWSSATFLADAHSPWWGVLSRLQLLHHHIEKAVMIRRTLHSSMSMTIVR